MSLDLRTQMKMKMSSTDKLSGKDKAKYLKSLREKEKEQEVLTIKKNEIKTQKIESYVKPNQIENNLIEYYEDNPTDYNDHNDKNYNSYSHPLTTTTTKTTTTITPSTTTSKNISQETKIESNDSLPVGFFDDITEEMTVRGVNILEEVKKQETQTKEQLQLFFDEVDNMVPVENDQESNEEQEDLNNQSNLDNEDIVQAAYEAKIGSLMLRCESNRKRGLDNHDDNHNNHNHNNENSNNETDRYNINYLEAENEVNEVLAQDHDIIETLPKDSESSIRDIIASTVARKRRKNVSIDDNLMLDPLSWNSRNF